jgi:hypothetical protein
VLEGTNKAMVPQAQGTAFGRNRMPIECPPVPLTHRFIHILLGHFLRALETNHLHRFALVGDEN